MNSTCKNLYSEFSTYNTCDISETVDYVFKYIVIISSFTLYFAQLFLYYMKRKIIKDKNGISYILIHLTIFHVIFMGIRPLIEIFTVHRSITNIYMALLTHAEVANSANIIILYIYFQLNIIFSGSLKNKKIYCIKNKEIILLIINLIQAVLFIIGPFLYHYSFFSANIVFWISVIIITITTIPFFSFLGLSLYFKINKLHNTRFKLVAKHILVMVILCGSVGIFTLMAAIFSMINTSYELILIELCWASNIYLNFVIFLLLTKNKTSIVTTSESRTDKKTSSRTSKSTKNI